MSLLDSSSLKSFLEKLLANHFPDGLNVGFPSLAAVEFSLSSVRLSSQQIKRKYYSSTSNYKFDYLNSDHMAMFLYFLSKYYAEAELNYAVASKFFYLNKIMNGIDLYHSVKMPEIFMFVHPVGTVIGAATFQNYFAIYQNVTIGSDANVYPTFGQGIVLFAGSKVIGDCQIGDNVIFGANSFILNSKVPSNCLVVGQYPNHKILVNTKNVKKNFFGIDLNGFEK